MRARIYPIAEDINVEINHIKDWIKNYFVENGPDCKAIIGLSGGKDSTVAAKLCVEALGKDKVIGVYMPQGKQHDIDIAHEVGQYLQIQTVEVNIGKICDTFYESFDNAFPFDDVRENSVVTSNSPARIRMSVLYAIAGMLHGRVVNTCNASEDFIGYSTKFGDSAGDFSPLSDYTVHAVKAIGYALGIPTKFIDKAPEDGLSGKTDEDNLGFTYEVLDAFLETGTLPEDYEVYKNIMERHKRNIHKVRPMPMCSRVGPSQGTCWEI